MSSLIVILGVTGNQGTSVADTFLHLPGWRVRGITRDPTKVQAQELTARGVEIVVADLNDVKSLIPAFTGATAIFAVTDFWAPMFSPETNSHLKPSQTLNEYCYDLELQQGRNIANAAAAESTMKTLKRFVYSSLSDAKRWSGGKYTWVYHFDAKAKVVEYVRQEQTELSERMSTVQIGEYADNWAKFPMLAPQKQPDGSFMLAKPGKGDAPIPMIVTQKDTGAFVKTLVELPPGVNVLGYGSFMGWEEYMKLWCSMLGVRGRFKQIPVSEYVKDLPEHLQKELSESYAYHAEFGWHGGDPDVVHPKQLGIDVPTTSIEEYIQSTDWSSIL